MTEKQKLPGMLPEGELNQPLESNAESDNFAPEAESLPMQEGAREPLAAPPLPAVVSGETSQVAETAAAQPVKPWETEEVRINTENEAHRAAREGGFSPERGMEVQDLVHRLAEKMYKERQRQAGDQLEKNNANE